MTNSYSNVYVLNILFLSIPTQVKLDSKVLLLVLISNVTTPATPQTK